MAAVTTPRCVVEGVAWAYHAPVICNVPPAAGRESLLGGTLRRRVPDAYSQQRPAHKPGGRRFLAKRVTHLPATVLLQLCGACCSCLRADGRAAGGRVEEAHRARPGLPHSATKATPPTWPADRCCSARRHRRAVTALPAAWPPEAQRRLLQQSTCCCGEFAPHKQRARSRRSEIGGVPEWRQRARPLQRRLAGRPLKRLCTFCRPTLLTFHHVID